MRIAALLLLFSACVLRAAPPANDHFAAASVQTGSFWLANGSLHEATSEANEPIISGFPNGPTAWWRWTATVSGPVRLRTWGSERENLLSVYRGTSLDTTRLVAFASGHFNRGNSAEVIFTATAGQTYHIQVLGTDYASSVFISDPFLPGRVQLSLTAAPGSGFVPANDDFAAAAVMTGASAELLVSNAAADGEAGEPFDMPEADGNSVWAVWTAPSTGVWTLSARQSDFDNELAVYTGTAVNALTRLNYADQAYTPLGGPDVGGGVVNFNATGGQTYRFQLVGVSLSGVEYGVCRLSLQPAVAPPNDAFANAITLTGTMPVAGAWATYATRESGEPGSAGDESGSLWWTWTAPSSGTLAVVSYEGLAEAFTGGSVAALTALPYDVRSGTRSTLGGVTYFYPVTSGTVLRLRGTPDVERVEFSLRILTTPANDDFAARALLNGGTTAASVNLDAASWENNEPDTDGLGPQTVWYRWTPPLAGLYVVDTTGSPDFVRVAVFTGSTLNTLAKVGTEKILGLSPRAAGRIFLNAAAGTEYSIQLRRETITPGLAQLHIRPAVPPANDHYASALTMNGSAWTANGSNVDATTEPNEPFPLQQGTSPAASVWWKWTAPATGIYRASTAGSGIDTVLSVYTGASLVTLTSVADDQSAAWQSTGSVIFTAQAGTLYTFRVDGQLNQEGALRLALAPAAVPPNDAFVSRLVLSGAGATATGSVLGATQEAGEPNPAGDGHSVWYDWTAPAAGVAFFKVVSDRFDPAVGIYSGTAVGSLSPLVTAGTGNPAATAQTFLIGYPVGSGQSYKVRVDGSPATNGHFTVSITMPAAPVNDNFAARTILTGAVVRTAGTNEGATRQTGEPAHAGSGAANSVWWEWTAPAAGTVALDTSGSTAQGRLAVYTGTVLTALTPVASDTIVFPETYASLTFPAAAGVTYLIAADSSDRGRGDLVLNLVSASAAPANDSFAAAVIWSGDAAESVADLRGATAEAGEPAHGGRTAARSLWWKWTPQSSRRARFWLETENAALTARLALYRDGALGSLVPVGALTSDNPRGRLQADVLAGQTYRLVLDSPAVAANPGWVRLGVAPENGADDNALLITPADGVLAANTTGGTNDDPALAPSARRELWYAWIPEVCARMEWRAVAPAGSGTVLSVSSSHTAATSQPVPGSNEVVATFDAVPDVAYFLKVSTTLPVPLTLQLVEAPRQPVPSNDLSYRAVAMSGSSWSTNLTLGAESENRQWWTWSAPAAGTVEVKLTGTLAENDALHAYANNDIDFSAGASRTNGGAPVLRLTSTRAGTLWRIATHTTLHRLRPATLSLGTAAGAPPANDSWNTPQVLAPGWTSAAGDVTFASCQEGEPDHSNSGGTGVATILPPGRSLWYDWTPSVSGPAVLRLDTSAPLAMRLYAGTQRAEWLPKATLAPGSRALPFFAYAGQTYHIAVAARPPFETTGGFTLRFGGPSNDMLASAITVPAAGGSSSVDSAGATVEDGEPLHSFTFENVRASLWWKWTASATGSVWMDTRGSEFDTVLTVFGTDPPDATSRIAESDNASTRAGSTLSAVRFAAVAGQSYLIRVCRRDAAEPSGIARFNVFTTAPAEPFQRWLAAWPALTGGDATETGDPDRDGLPNLMELALGTSPVMPNSRSPLTPAALPTGWHVEAALDMDAIEAPGASTPLEVIWQTSRNLTDWQPGPPATVAGRDGGLILQRITLTRDDPPFVRLMVRKAR
jgi:hypothetical protein